MIVLYQLTYIPFLVLQSCLAVSAIQFSDSLSFCLLSAEGVVAEKFYVLLCQSFLSERRCQRRWQRSLR